MKALETSRRLFFINKRFPRYQCQLLSSSAVSTVEQSVEIENQINNQHYAFSRELIKQSDINHLKFLDDELCSSPTEMGLISKPVVYLDLESGSFAYKIVDSLERTTSKTGFASFEEADIAAQEFVQASEGVGSIINDSNKSAEEVKEDAKRAVWLQTSDGDKLDSNFLASRIAQLLSPKQRKILYESIPEYVAYSNHNPRVSLQFLYFWGKTMEEKASNLMPLLIDFFDVDEKTSKFLNANELPRGELDANQTIQELMSKERDEEIMMLLKLQSVWNTSNFQISQEINSLIDGIAHLKHDLVPFIVSAERFKECATHTLPSTFNSKSRNNYIDHDKLSNVYNKLSSINQAMKNNESTYECNSEVSNSLSSILHSSTLDELTNHFNSDEITRATEFVDLFRVNTSLNGRKTLYKTIEKYLENQNQGVSFKDTYHLVDTLSSIAGHDPRIGVMFRQIMKSNNYEMLFKATQESRQLSVVIASMSPQTVYATFSENIPEETDVNTSLVDLNDNDLYVNTVDYQNARLSTDTSDDAHLKWYWRGMGDRWYQNVDHAHRSFYSRDIAGGYGDLRSERQALIALKKSFQQLRDTEFLRTLHAVSEQYSKQRGGLSDLQTFTSRLALLLSEEQQRRFTTLLKNFWTSNLPDYNTANGLKIIGTLENQWKRKKTYNRAMTHQDFCDSAQEIFGVENSVLLVPWMMRCLNQLTVANVSHANLVVQNVEFIQDHISSNTTNALMDELKHRVGDKACISLEKTTSRVWFNEAPRPTQEVDDDEPKRFDSSIVSLDRLEPCVDFASHFGFRIWDEGEEASMVFEEDFVERTLYIDNVPSKLNASELYNVLSKTMPDIERVSVHNERTSAGSKVFDLVYKNHTQSTFTSQDVVNNLKNASSSNNSMLQSIGEIPTIRSETNNFRKKHEQLSKISNNLHLQMREAVDLSYWIDNNWYSIPKEEAPSNLELADLEHVDLSARLLTITDELSEEFYVVNELLSEYKRAISSSQSYWDKFSKATDYKALKIKGVKPPTWPKTIDDLVMQGNENLFRALKLKTNSTVAEERADEINAISNSLAEKFGDFKTSLIWLARINKETPVQLDNLLELFDTLVLYNQEAQRRKLLAEKSVKMLLAQQQASSSEAEIQGVNAPQEEEEDEDLDWVDDEPVGSDGFDMQDFPTEVSIAEEMLDEYDGTEMQELNEDHVQNLEDFKMWYLNVRGMKYSDRFKQAMQHNMRVKNERNFSKRKQDHIKKLLPEMLPTSGAYAFVTFKSHEAIQQAAIPALEVFGFTVAVDKFDARNLEGEPSAESEEELTMEHHREHHQLSISKAADRRTLFIGNLPLGISADEIAQCINSCLVDRFEYLSFRSTSLPGTLCNGTCHVQFRSFAESMVAYELLKDQIINGNKIVVGWRESEFDNSQATKDKTVIPQWIDNEY